MMSFLTNSEPGHFGQTVQCAPGARGLDFVTFFELVCLIQWNDIDGLKFLGFYEGIEAAKRAVAELPLESQELEWSRDKGQWLTAWSGHDHFYIHEIPGAVIR